MGDVVFQRWRRLTGWASALAVLLLAAYLRFARLDLSQFRADEADFLALAASILDSGHIPLVGARSSTGIFTSPLFVYFLALPLALARSVALVNAAVAALNLLAVAFCYRVVSRHFGRAAALMATLLFATGFWMVLYSRRALDVSATPLTAVLLLGSLLGWAAEGRRWQLAWSVLWLSVGVQLHVSFVAWVAPFLVLLVVFWRRISWKALALGVVLAAAAAAPWLAWEVGNGWYNLRASADVAEAPSTYGLSAVRLALHLLSTNGFNTNFGQPEGSLLAEPAVVRVLRQALVVALFLGLGFLMAHVVGKWRRGLSPQGRGYAVVLACTLLPVAFYLRHSLPLHAHYFLGVYPLPYVALAVGVSALVRSALGWVRARWTVAGVWSGRLASGAVVGFFVAQGGAAVWVWTAFLGWVDGQAALPNYGLPLKYVERAMSEARDAAEQVGAERIYVMAEPEQVAAVYRFLGESGEPPVVVAKDYRSLVLPAEGPAVVLSASAHSRAGIVLRERLREASVASVAYPGEGDWIAVYSLLGDEPRRAAFETVTSPLGFELTNGVTLERYYIPERVTAGRELVAQVVWSVGPARELVGQGQYRFFAHLVDNEGQLYGQHDDLGYRREDWRTGDRVLEWHALRVAPEAPRGQYWLLLGMYDLSTMARVPLASGGDYVRLGPVKVVSPGFDGEAVLRAAEYRQEVTFQGGVSLVGYSLLNASSSREVRLQLLWRCDRDMESDYTVYVHLVDAEGRVLSQDDGPPDGGRYPTSMWDAGEIIPDERVLPLPTGASVDGLTVVAGWYSPESGSRLLVRSGSTRSDGAVIDLGQ